MHERRRDCSRARPGRHLRRPRRSDPASHPGAPRGRGGLGDGARRPVRHEPAGDLEAPQGARAGTPRGARTRRPAAAAAAGRGSARPGQRLARSLPRILGGELRPARRRPRGAQSRSGETATRTKERRAQMTTKKTLTVTTPSDREIAMARDFDAPRTLVWDAFTRPELIKRWLGVIPGWSMATCEVDLRVGGAFRYVWNGPGDTVMEMRGAYLEIADPARLVSTEIFDKAWYEGEAVGTLVLTERDARTTTATTIVRYASREVRDAVLKTPMARGVS